MPKKGQSLWGDAWRRLKKNKFAMGGLVVMVLVSLTAILAPWLVVMDADYGQPWLRHARAPGFTHPAVLAAIRFDKGDAPVVPERIPPRIARYLSTDGTLVYTVHELDDAEYRVRMRRGKIREIRRGAVSVTELVVRGELSVARLLDSEGQPTGVELRDLELTKKQALPDALSEHAKEKILLIRVRTPRTENAERIEITLRSGVVAEITRDGKSIDKLRTDGRFVHEITKDGEPQEFRHVLGTDDVGRDVWARVVYGGQISLMVGFIATLVSMFIGVIYGAISGYLAQAPMNQWQMIATLTAIGVGACGLALNHLLGLKDPKEQIGFIWLLPAAIGLFIGALAIGLALVRPIRFKRVLTTWGEFMMRVVDILYALPFMFLVILLMIAYGRDLITLFIALGAVQWLMMARIVRGQVLSLKEKEFVEAARMCGSSHGSIIFRHLIPNTLGVVAVYATLTVPAVILQESFLSFIGLSVQFDGRTLDSWGSLVDQGRKALTASGDKWWILVFPSLAMAVTLFSLNFLGDGLRDALDPKLKGKS